ncbi:unnamed protein product, partial [Symbiodinium pilosum]
EGKTILIAEASNWNQLASTLLWGTFSGLLGMLLGWGLKLWYQHEAHPLLLCVAVLAATLSANARGDTCRMMLNRVGILVCCALLFQWHTVRGNYTFQGNAVRIPYVEQRIVILIVAMFFMLLEVDRVNGLARSQGAQQLSNGFEGRIGDAKCSEAADTARILKEIGKKTESVDFAIHVL